MKPIIIVCGLSGTGKTFYSKILESKLEGYSRLHLGLFREQLGITTYSRKDTPKLLAKIIEQMEQNHQQNVGSLLDANLKSVDLRQCFYDLAKHLGINLILVEMNCPEEIAKQRMGRREPVAKIENPTDSRIYDQQKLVWQDTLLDFQHADNEHVTLLRFNSGTKEVELLKGNLADSSLMREIVQTLVSTYHLPQILNKLRNH